MYAAAMLAFASVGQPIPSPRIRPDAGREAGARARRTSTGRIGWREDHATIRLPFVSRMRNHPR